MMRRKRTSATGAMTTVLRTLARLIRGHRALVAQLVVGLAMTGPRHGQGERQ